MYAIRSYYVKFDFLFSIGGDGTFLESATVVKGSGIPVVGINTGRLGVITSYSIHYTKLYDNSQFSFGYMAQRVKRESGFKHEINKLRFVFHVNRNNFV